MQSLISQNQSIELLGRLAQDSTFRQAFRDNPGGALRTLGVDIGDVGAISVPTTEEAEHLRNELTASRRRQGSPDFCGAPMPMWPVFTATLPKGRVH